MMRKTCDAVDCAAEAGWQPTIEILALGWARGTHRPLQMLVGLFLCDVHRSQFQISDFLGLDLQTRMQLIAQSCGKCPPDFERAEISWQPQINWQDPAYSKQVGHA